MSFEAFSRSRAPMGSVRRAGVAGRVGCREDVALRVAHRDAQGMADRVGAVDFVLADEARQDGKARGVGRGPPFRAPVVGVQVEEGARPGRPLRAVPVKAEQLVEGIVVLVDDEHVAIPAGILVSGLTTLDPVRPRYSGIGDRVEGERGVPVVVVDAVALVRVLEGDGAKVARLDGAHDDVGKAVDADVAGVVGAAAEVRVELARGADERDERAGLRVDGRLADVLIPPVVRGEQGQRDAEGPALCGGGPREIRSREKNAQEQHQAAHRGAPWASVSRRE